MPPDANVPFDHPDGYAALGGWDVPMATANETFAFQVEKSPDPLVTENVYSYYVDLAQAQPLYGTPSGPFPQVQGEKYWLVVVALHQDQNRQWGWHEADGHWGSYAVQLIQGSQLYVPCGGHDMAFELIVPEPGSLCALAMGLTGLMGLAGSRPRSRS